MRILNDLKVKNKLMLISAVSIIFIFFIASFSYIELQRANMDMTSMYKDRLLSIKWLNDNKNHRRAIEADIYYIILHTDNKEKQNEKMKDIEKRVKEFNENLENYKKPI